MTHAGGFRRGGVAIAGGEEVVLRGKSSTPPGGGGVKSEWPQRSVLPETRRECDFLSDDMVFFFFL